MDEPFVNLAEPAAASGILARTALLVLLAVTCGSGHARGACTDAQYRAIAAKVATDDGKGHGPDIGSDEWKSTVEFRLGVRGNASVPARDSAAWCPYVERLAAAHVHPGGSGASGATGAAPAPVPGASAGPASPAKAR